MDTYLHLGMKTPAAEHIITGQAALDEVGK